MDQESRDVRLRPASFYHLLGQPVRIRMCSDPRVHNLSSAVVDDEKDKKGAEPKSLNR